MKRSQLRCGWLVVLAGVIPVAAWAASPEKKPAGKEPARTVGLFEGIEAGEIEVTVIPKDAKEGTVTIKNKTDKPLSIKLPDAFAGVPVLAQGGALAGAGLGGGGNAGNAGGGGNQGFGGGMGGMMGGGMMGGGMGGMGGGGFFNVPAEKVMKGKMTIVCLDHGLKDPNPRVPYKLIPIEQYAKNPVVSEVVKMLVRGEIDQHSAQAAAWHLQSGLSWEELAKKIGIKHINGSVEPYFLQGHLERAFVATRVATEKLEKAPSEGGEPTRGKSLNEPSVGESLTRGQ